MSLKGGEYKCSTSLKRYQEKRLILSAAKWKSKKQQEKKTRILAAVQTRRIKFLAAGNRPW
ncbi:hypothetical protein [Mesobacillus foraminis]|uniref:hypothetical protein n=1 Tax=Mesobacillus foraminis TaxID=279826 RepID=UPI000EF506F1|nr:hypothetical protein [Mesobacillus foraminis]